MRSLTRRSVLETIPALPAAALALRSAAAASPGPVSPELFEFDGSANIREENHFGIINQLATMGVNYRDVTALSGLYAPPFASSDFFLEMRLYGDRVPTREYRWNPWTVWRQGVLNGVSVTSTIALAADMRAGVLAITLENATPGEKTVPLQFTVTGGLDYVKFWGFPRPDTAKKVTSAAAEGNRVLRSNDAGAFAIASDLPELAWEDWSSHWVTSVRLARGERKTFHVACAIGTRQDCLDACRAILAGPEKAIARSREAFAERTQDLFRKLPAFQASDQRLTAYYNRSLVHLLLNQWRVPEFVVNPYYSTGAIKGGCVGCYLWDYGLIAELLPLYDPQAVKAHIRQFLKIDLTRHFLFNPVDGQADGPWYPANQHSILASIYYCVLHTGDVAFLSETVGDRSILEWAIFQATYKDDLTQPAALVDYGKKVSHLELRRQYTYEQILPDLNGMRYENYRITCQLMHLAGKPPGDLQKRMLPLRRLLKESLWSPRDRWFYYQADAGGKQLRFTNIVYLLFGTGVLDKEQEEGLLTHLNEKEFLSAYGLHSISKQDPAFDQVDIDHGGGGSYVAFPPRIAEALYKAGYARQAEDILRRTLWWAERMPFWGDSFVANEIDYRKDTPLQSDIAAAAGAQFIIFGMFGIAVMPDGAIVVDPKPPQWSRSIRLSGMRLRGKEFDVAVDGNSYEVILGRKVLRARVGEATRLT